MSDICWQLEHYLSSFSAYKELGRKSCLHFQISVIKGLFSLLLIPFSERRRAGPGRSNHRSKFNTKLWCTGGFIFNFRKLHVLWCIFITLIIRNAWRYNCKRGRFFLIPQHEVQTLSMMGLLQSVLGLQTQLQARYHKRLSFIVFLRRSKDEVFSHIDL